MIEQSSTIGTQCLNQFIIPKIDTSNYNTSSLVNFLCLVTLTGATFYAITTIRSHLFFEKKLANDLSKAPLTEEVKKVHDTWSPPLPVKKTLDQLFVNSPYSLDTIPFYPATPDTDNIERQRMEAPIMKGTLNGHRFIIIKVDCDLSNEEIVKKCSLLKRFSLKHDRKIKETIVLAQTYEDNLNKRGHKKFAWIQLNDQDFPSPSFFNQNFISNNGSGPTRSQKDNFKLLQTLIKTGTSQDRQGLTWTISSEN